MGSFKGHVIAGFLFLAVGVWHIWSAVVRFVSDPAGFRVRAWNPVEGMSGRLRHLELYVVAVGVTVDICIELLYATHLRFFVGPDRILNPAHMNDFEHAGMLFMFFLFAAAVLVSEKTRYLPLPEGSLCLIVTFAFITEYLLFNLHSSTHKGVEGYYHRLLVVLIALSIASSVAGALFPTSLPADLANAVSLTLQGLWFYQTALTLYGRMMPAGCHFDDHTNTAVCQSDDALIRAQLLANLQLSYLVFLVFTLVIGFYVLAAKWYGHPELGSFVDAQHGVEENGEEFVAH